MPGRATRTMTQPSAANETRPAIVPLALSAILNEPLPALGAFRGRVTDKRPHSKHTQLAQLTLAAVDRVEPIGSAFRVELKGSWADKAVRRLMKGDILVLLTTGMVILGNEGNKTQGNGAPRVRFDQGVTGWIRRKDGSEELWSFPDPGAQSRRRVMPSTLPT